ncbi:tetratricopeptide repeat protein [Parahaliea mediterranea]|uniref:tetratricopeptide repeat protein n=1 Tax=Parahaliea mediterranea TaxID=651086 RepID=UPI000E2F53E4|nr:tetratricopeptide repeat protein [Parahaliea mediterranea]
MMRRALLLPLWLAASLYSAPGAAALSLVLPEPNWRIDAAFEPLREREAGLLPQEHKLAAQLRPLVAKGDYQGALARLSSADSASFSAALRYVQAQLYLAAGDAERARATYLQTLQQMPDFQRAHRGLAAVYLQLDDPGNARKHLTRAIALGAYDAQVFGQLAYINLREGSAWSAVSGYQQALFLEPGNTQWQQGLIIALVRTRHYDAARALLEDALAQQPDDATLWLQHSNLALHTQDNTTALASLEMAARLGGLDAANALVAAQLHLQQGSLQRGLALLKGKLTAFDGEQSQTLVQTVQWLAQRGEGSATSELASVLLNSGLSLSASQRSAVLAARGQVRLAGGQRERGQHDLAQASELDPANGEALLALAESHRDTNPYRASTLFERAASLPDYEERACLGRAQLAVDQHDYERALELLVRARQLNPHLGGLAANIASLQRLVALEQYQP